MSPFVRNQVSSHLGWSIFSQGLNLRQYSFLISENAGDAHKEADSILNKLMKGMVSRATAAYERVKYATFVRFSLLTIQSFCSHCKWVRDRLQNISSTFLHPFLLISHWLGLEERFNGVSGFYIRWIDAGAHESEVCSLCTRFPLFSHLSTKVDQRFVWGVHGRNAEDAQESHLLSKKRKRDDKGGRENRP